MSSTKEYGDYAKSVFICYDLYTQPRKTEEKHRNIAIVGSTVDCIIQTVTTLFLCSVLINVKY